MEAINDGSKLIAQSIDLLNKTCGCDNKDQNNIDDTIKLLEQALEKLINNM